VHARALQAKAEAVSGTGSLSGRGCPRGKACDAWHTAAGATHA
jgi:hypothetical protein